MTVRSDRWSSIYALNGLIAGIIGGYRKKGFECDVYTASSRSYGEHWSGRCFRFKRRGREEIIYPLFVVDFKEEPPVIALSFDKDWCRGVFERLNGKKKAGKFYNLNSTGHEVRFELTVEGMKKLYGSPPSVQKAILRKFFGSVLADVAPLI